MKEGKYFSSNFKPVFSKYLCHIRTKKVKRVTSERLRKNSNLVAGITQIFRVWRPLALNNVKFVASHSLSEMLMFLIRWPSHSQYSVVELTEKGGSGLRTGRSEEYQGSRYGLLQSSIHTTVSRRGIALAWIKTFNGILRKHAVKLLTKRTRF